jgi:hypothetical protein
MQPHNTGPGQLAHMKMGEIVFHKATLGQVESSNQKGGKK